MLYNEWMVQFNKNCKYKHNNQELYKAFIKGKNTIQKYAYLKKYLKTYLKPY